jgi:phage terminase large subunit-like protein
MSSLQIKKAERVKKFIEKYCTYSKGEWAGKPFKLLPWQWDELIKPLFGTINDEGYRQYRIAYVEVPKKNGKTELIAAIGLYMLTNDGEKGAEVYCAASDREQAGLAYQAATAMVRNNEELSKHCRLVDSRKRIYYAKTNSFLQVLSSESYTKHGLNPSCVIIDEIHAHPNDELYNVLTAGTDYARRQQVVLVITTAGIYDVNSIWWRLRSKAIQVRDGIVNDSRFLPVLYLADPEKDKPDDEELWKRVNPSLGQIFSLDKIRQDYNEAKQNPIDFQNFLRFRLNIPIRQLTRFIPMDKWDACKGSIDLEFLKGRKCYGGLDLSSREDLAARVLVFPPDGLDGLFYILCKFYCPEEGIIKRSRTDQIHYDIWADQGYLTATPGNVIDYAWIEKDILQDAIDYQLLEIGYDSWNAQATATRIQEALNPSNDERGFHMVEMRQGFKTMNEPAKDLLVHIMTGKIRHGGHPVLRWCADNLVVRSDPNGNVAPDKEKATEKIDGMVALMMGWGRAMFSEDTTSIYEERGILTL